MKFVVSRNRRMWTKSQYTVFLVALWVYAIVWMTLGLATLFFFTGILKWIVVVVLIIGTPSDLFMSYSAYQRWWSEHVIEASHDEQSQESSGER